MDRREKILYGIDRGMRILELGPGYSPITPKSEGWNVCTVDHASREEIVEKYREDPSGVDVSRVEEVDVVWTGGQLEEAMPSAWHGTFDACIASHVLEHVPDPVGLFRSLERVLSPTGVISLAVPDKRFCFDYFKPLSSTGELLEAHLQRVSRHRVKTMFDHLAYSAKSSGAPSWDEKPVTELALFTSLEAVRQHVERYTSEGEAYEDCHAWHFTPSSFALVMIELAALELVDFSITHSFPTEGVEFFATLGRGRSVHSEEELEAQRLQLLVSTVHDVGVQTRLLVQGASPAEPTAEWGKPALLARIEALERELAAMRTSESWRMTAPLRSVGRRVRRLARARGR